jgi:hypothetical protein
MKMPGPVRVAVIDVTDPLSVFTPVTDCNMMYVRAAQNT